MKTLDRISDRISRRIAICMVLAGAPVGWACAPAGEEGETAAAGVEQPAATAAGVEAAFQAFVDAWEAEDVEAAVGAFTTDAVAFDPVPPGKFGGPEGIRAWASGAFEALEGITITVSEVSAATEGRVGWLTAHYVFEGQAPDESVRDEGYLSSVWVLQDDGSYKATLFHASIRPEEPPAMGL